MDALDRALRRLPHWAALFLIMGTFTIVLTAILALGAYAVVTP